MRKGLMIALIIALVLVLIGLIMMGIAWARGVHSIDLSNLNIGIGNMRLGTNFGYEDLDSGWNDAGSYSVPASGVHTVEVLWVSGTVRIQPGDTADIRFTESCRETLTETNSLRWRVRDGVLTIQYCKGGRVNFEKLPEKELEVLLPPTLAGFLNELKVSNVSGGIRSERLTARRMEYATTSGGMVLTDQQTERLKLDTVSGDVQFRGSYLACEAGSVSGELHIERTEDGSSAERTEAGSVSGAVQLHGPVGEFKVGTTSGAVSVLGSGWGTVTTVSGNQWLEGEISALDAGSTSGSVTLITSVQPREIEIDTTSGDVSLTLPADCGFTLDFDTSSGDFISALAMVNQRSKHIYGDGAAAVDVDTTSGDLRVDVR